MRPKNPIVITPLIAEYFRQLGTGWEVFEPYLADGKTLLVDYYKDHLTALEDLETIRRQYQK